MSPAVERYQVMLTHGEKLNVFHQNQFVVIFVENRSVCHLEKTVSHFFQVQNKPSTVVFFLSDLSTHMTLDCSMILPIFWAKKSSKQFLIFGKNKKFWAKMSEIISKQSKIPK